MRVVVDVKPPRFVAILAGIIDPDPRAGGDAVNTDLPVFDPQYFALHVLAVQILIDGHGEAQLAWTAGDVDVAWWVSTPPAHQSDVLDRFDGANQNSRRIVFVVRDD